MQLNDAERLVSDTALDLRRKHQRELIDRLVVRACSLPPTDRALIEAVFLRGKSVSSIASPELPNSAATRRLRRRLHILCRRLESPLFTLVLAQATRWSATRRKVATACVLHGRSIRHAAAELGLSLHTVRRNLDAIRALADAATHGRAA